MFTKDPLFWTAMKNTAWIIIIGVPLRILAAIVTASLLVRPRRGVKAYRTMFFVPTLAPAVAAALAFLYLFNPATGPVNQVLSGIGIDDPPLWLYDAQWSKPTLVLLDPLGRRRRDDHLPRGHARRAAPALRSRRHRGRRGWQQFRLVTLPLISPVIFFSLVIGVIYGFQYFTQPYVISFWLTR